MKFVIAFSLISITFAHMNTAPNQQNSIITEMARQVDSTLSVRKIEFFYHNGGLIRSTPPLPVWFDRNFAKKLRLPDKKFCGVLYADRDQKGNATGRFVSK